MAILISRTRLPSRPVSTRQLVDFGGFKDPRYLTLAIGSVLVSLGLYSPYYYIGMSPCVPLYCLLNLSIEPFAIEYGVPMSVHAYLLSMINGVSFFGRIM